VFDAEWLKPIDRFDVFRMSIYITLLASFSDPRVADAVLALGMEETSDHSMLSSKNFALSEAMGSNSYALGSEVTQTGKAMLLGNPHYPWRGPRRFYQVHMTIPGEMNIMGITILGSSLINVGFTDKLAWTHTVSNANRFTLYELDLSDQDRDVYFFDRKRLRIRSMPVTVEVKEDDGTLTEF
jgi:acyl-homoserine-lactone acylase